MTAFALYDPQDLRTLYSAVWRNNANKMNEMLDKGLPVNHRYANGRTLAHVAAWFNHAPLMVELIKRQAQLDVVDELGTTPLLLSIQNKSFACFKVLAAQKILSSNVLTSPTSSSETPIAQSLIMQSVPTGLLAGTTPVHELCRLGLLDWLSYVKQQDLLSSLSIRNQEGDTLAHVASKAQQFKVLSWLIQQGIDLNLSNEQGVLIKDLPRFGPSKKKGMKKEVIHSDLAPATCAPAP